MNKVGNRTQVGLCEWSGGENGVGNPAGGELPQLAGQRVLRPHLSK